jgi:plastocyanin
MKFVPERLEVAAGDRITWTNRDIVPHTVTAKAAGLESGELAQGKSWTYVARKPGTIAYICRLHPVMHGMLIVK